MGIQQTSDRQSRGAPAASPDTNTGTAAPDVDHGLRAAPANTKDLPPVRQPGSRMGGATPQQAPVTFEAVDGRAFDLTSPEGRQAVAGVAMSTSARNSMKKNGGGEFDFRPFVDGDAKPINDERNHGVDRVAYIREDGRGVRDFNITGREAHGLQLIAAANEAAVLGVRPVDYHKGQYVAYYEQGRDQEGRLRICAAFFSVSTDPKKRD